jgi:nitrate/TMAO reductase-like tetraheme cytochrome c subunit
METGEKVIIALVVLVTVGVIGGAAIMMPIMMHEMEKPESCASNCHEMQPFYDSLEVSAHKGVDCHDCHHSHEEIVDEMFMYMGHATHHAEAIAGGMMEGKSMNEALDELAHHIEEKPPASPKSEWCMECHEERNVEMPEVITGTDISCVECHDGIRENVPLILHTEHPVGEYKGYESPSYEGYECVACHNDHDVNVNKEETCDVCHPLEKTH